MFQNRHAAVIVLLTFLCAARAHSADPATDLPAAPPAEPPAADRAQLDSSFQQALDEVADVCDRLALKEQAQITRAWYVSRQPGRQYVFLPRGVDSFAPPESAADPVKKWYEKFRGVRQAQAAELFKLAERALAREEFDVAYQLVYEVLREDPDHKAARSILAYVVAQRLPDADQPAPAKTRHGLLGWPRYWKVTTPHFEISTDHSWAEGVDLGRRLEELHVAWRQMFFRHWSSGRALAGWFEQGGPAGLTRVSTKKYHVVCFRDRDEYQAAMAKHNPGLGETEGLYLDQRGEVWLYAGHDAVARETALHEVTHQLFHETIQPARNVGDIDNFWIIEGIALYMQSFASRGEYGYATLGGFDARRLQFARYWLKNQGYYLPLADLTSLGKLHLQRHEDLQRLYTQSAGLTHFLMNHEQGRYRDGVIDYLRLVYAGAQKSDTLAKLTGVEFRVLDEQYKNSLSVTDEDLLQRLNPPQFVTVLTLGGTEVTNEGLKALAGYDRLELLDLSATRVTDEGLVHLAGLANLNDLWLTGTAVTDQGLAHLGGLKKLARVEVSGTKVTPDGLAKLKQSLPLLGGP